MHVSHIVLILHKQSINNLHYVLIMKPRGEIQHFTNLIYKTQFQKVNVLSILKDISMNIVNF
jgi:hypothetical protein